VAIGNLTYPATTKCNTVLPRRRHIWRLHDFRRKLQRRFNGLDEQKVVIQDERYTTKMCGLCKNIKQNVGTAKRYICDKCGYDVDRDVNGARNILSLSVGLTDTPE
jgi:putative transposase